MAKLETVLIEHEGFPDGMRINKADFRPDEHVPFGQAVKSLEAMTVKELRVFAGDHAITLGADVTTKDAILAAIQNSDWQLNSADPKE